MAMPPRLTLSGVPGIPLIAPGDDLGAIIATAMDRAGLPCADGDIIVIAQKIVSKAENRYVNLADVTPSKEAHRLAAIVGKDPRHVETVLRESSEVVKCRQNVMIVAHRLGFVMANAGIDESNIDHGEDGARVREIAVDRVARAPLRDGVRRHDSLLPEAEAATLTRALPDKFLDVAVGVFLGD